MKKNVSFKIIFPKTDKLLGEQRSKLSKTEVRYSDITVAGEWGVVEDIFFMLHFSKQSRGFLIKDKVFADTFKELFEKVWVEAKD